MEFQDIAKKSEVELKKLLAEQRGVLYDLRLKVSVGQLKDMARMKKTKKIIARILTRLKQLSYDNR